MKENNSLQKSQILTGTLTGYPSVDKPWMKYYEESDLGILLPKKTVYQEVFEKNKDYKKELALEFFGSKISFGDFFAKVEATAKSFEEYGIKKGDFVTICAAGIPETAYSFYALSKLGAIANMIAPHFDKNDLIRRISDCESDILIVMDKFYPILKDSIKKSRIKKVIVLPTLNSSILNLISKKYKCDKFSNEILWNQFIKDGRKRGETQTLSYEKNIPLAMVYSSGTTGASKGILLSNDSFQNSVNAYLKSGLDISRGQKFYQIIPTWFSTGLSTSLHLPLSIGASVFMDPRFEREIFVKNVLKAKPNYTVAPTSMYEGFLDEKLLGNKDLSFFNHPYEGGEALSKEMSDKIESVFAKHGNDSKLMVGYGQCECGATVTTETPKTNHSGGSVGIPLPGITIGVFDDEFNELKYNERGNILANTPCGMLEYYKNPEATNEYFYYDKDNTKWSCTGDIGHIDENGELYIDGRSSDYTMINDKKIYNFDIENVIKKLPEIKNCDVLQTMDTNQNIALGVHIVFEKGFDIDKQREMFGNIQELIYSELKDIDAVPYVFKVRESFPYAKSGKRDVEALKKETTGFIEIEQYNVLNCKTKNRIIKK